MVGVVVAEGALVNVAVLTLTRDRLAYTQECFQSLREHAGCDYDHFVLDNGSTDGTLGWLEDGPFRVFPQPANIGISRGMNLLLNQLDDDYDVVVKIDNDCLLTQPNTLRGVCELVIEGGCILSPRILGLRNPPQPTRELRIGDEIIQDVPQIGGIFLAAPGWVYDEFRYDESAPLWGMDDVEICRWFRQQGGTCGYVKRLEAWHHETTDGQHERFPDYFAARVAAGGPA